MKKLTILTLISFVLFSASSIFGQESKKAMPAAASAEYQVKEITPERFQDYAIDNVGKPVEIQGMVVHVCKHGGKKLFIIGEDPDMRVKITASDKVSVFEPELEGSTILVRGVIEPIAEEEAIAAEEKANEEDADHANYYHKPQFSISCMAIRTLEE